MNSGLNESQNAMLDELRRMIDLVPHLQMFDLTDQEIMKYTNQHPHADFILGDFEIRCINPEKYGLPPRQPET